MKIDINILESSRKFVEHKIASANTEDITAIMFEYLMAGNGLFIRAKRREFSVCLPVCSQQIKGLPNSNSGIVWHKPKIPVGIWEEILSEARWANDFTKFKEDVFVVFWHEESCEWRWKRISRERKKAATIADDTLLEYGEACIELHTHPKGANHFSQADDADECGKFRIFGILTGIHSIFPKLRLRCGVFDNFFQIPVDFVSEMPRGFIDLNREVQTFGRDAR